METTSGLGLKLPGDSDYFDIEDMNYNTRKIDQEFQKSINSEQGMHGIRYLDKSFWIYNSETHEWEKAAGGLPPRPVTDVIAIAGTGQVDIIWNKPNVYDVQIGAYNVYVAHSSSTPTDISQFTLKATVETTSYTYTTNSTSDCYVLIAPVSTGGIENTELTGVTKTVSSFTFSSATWKQIDLVAQNNKASNYFAVGDQKSITIGTTSYKVAIYGFNHDDLSDGSGKAKMTIGLVNCLATTYAMNSSNTNVGGWTGSQMYQTLNEAIFGDLPEELRNLIKPVKKKTSAGNQLTTINVSNDKLFLFSEHEIFGSKSYSVGNEGTRYAIFATSSNRVKKLGDSGSAYYWWERSPGASNATYFCGVNSDGSANATNASSAYGVCFGFCI